MLPAEPAEERAPALRLLRPSVATRGASYCSLETSKKRFLDKAPAPQVRVHPRTYRHTPTPSGEGTRVPKTPSLLPRPCTGAGRGGPASPRRRTAELATAFPHDARGAVVAMGIACRRPREEDVRRQPCLTRPGASRGRHLRAQGDARPERAQGVAPREEESPRPAPAHPQAAERDPRRRSSAAGGSAPGLRGRHRLQEERRAAASRGRAPRAPGPPGRRPPPPPLPAGDFEGDEEGAAQHDGGAAQQLGPPRHLGGARPQPGGSRSAGAAA